MENFLALQGCSSNGSSYQGNIKTFLAGRYYFIMVDLRIIKINPIPNKGEAMLL